MGSISVSKSLLLGVLDFKQPPRFCCCLRMIKMDIFALNNSKYILVSNGKDGTLSMYSPMIGDIRRIEQNILSSLLKPFECEML